MFYACRFFQTLWHNGLLLPHGFRSPQFILESHHFEQRTCLNRPSISINYIRDRTHIRKQRRTQVSRYVSIYRIPIIVATHFRLTCKDKLTSELCTTRQKTVK